MFGKIKREQEQQRRDITWLAEETRKLRDLFTKDRHGTERPKVDMLTESINRSEFSIGQSIRLIDARLKVLEKKCKIK